MHKNNNDMKLIEKIVNVKELLFYEMGKMYDKQEISSTELMIIYFVRHSKMNIKTGELSTAMFIPMSTLTGILDKMERKGIILRERRKEDRRTVYIVINPDFEMHSGQFLDGVAKMMSEVKSEVSQEQFEDFFATLSVFERVLKKRADANNG